MKAAEQKGITTMPGCTKVWRVRAVDPTSPVLTDAGEQSAGATLSCPPGRRKGRTRRLQDRAEEPESRWKGTRDKGADWGSQGGFLSP
jgi:hypothetical protein